MQQGNRSGPSLDGYWGEVVTTALPYARNYEESWNNRTVKFRLDVKFGKTLIELEPLQNLRERLGARRCFLRVEERCSDAMTLLVTYENVRFPTRPENEEVNPVAFD